MIQRRIAQNNRMFISEGKQYLKDVFFSIFSLIWENGKIMYYDPYSEIGKQI